jgi:hypothetical protein
MTSTIAVLLRSSRARFARERSAKDSRIHGTTDDPIKAMTAPSTTAQPESIPELYFRGG